MDIRGYYIKIGDLSFELDAEHTDEDLTGAEMALLGAHLSCIKTALHLCCGAGRHVRAFAGRRVFSLGLDISPYLLAKGIERLRGGDVGPGAHLFRGDAVAIPIRSRSMECVTLLGNSFIFFSEDERGRLLQEVRRVLGPGGVFIMDIPCPAHMKSTLTHGAEIAKSIRTRSLGEVTFNWKRRLSDDGGFLISRETIGYHDEVGRLHEMEMVFHFPLYEPGEICSLAAAEGFRLMCREELEDPFNRYKGMLKRRIFFVFGVEA